MRKAAKACFEEVKYWIELVFRPAARPGAAGNRDRLPAVYLSLVNWLHETRKAFKLEQEIDAILKADPHKLTSGLFSYATLRTDKNLTEVIAGELGMTPKELLEKFKRQRRGLKRQDQVFLQALFEVRKAWDTDKHEIARGSIDPCKEKKILPKGEYVNGGRFENSQQPEGGSQIVIVKDQGAREFPNRLFEIGHGSRKPGGQPDRPNFEWNEAKPKIRLVFVRKTAYFFGQ